MLATTKPLPAISPVMPLITASCAGPCGSCSRFQASESVSAETLMRLLPIQCALVPLVDKANGQNTEEAQHREKAKQADSRQADRPGKQKGDFYVENNKQNGNEVKADIETASGI